MSRRGIAHDCRLALRDVSETCRAVGAELEFRVREESDITRDRYNTISRRQSERALRLYGLLETNPSQNQREAAGLFEESEVTVWTASEDWRFSGLDFQDIDIKRTSVVVGGAAFEVAEKGRRGQCQDRFLWYTFGLRRR